MRHDATQVAKKKLSPPMNTVATEVCVDYHISCWLLNHAQLHKMAHSSHHRLSVTNWDGF
jgi:hypothetical protein